MSNKDKAGEKYWSEVWENAKLQPPMDIKSKSVNNYGDRIFYNLLKKSFNGLNTSKLKLLEIGCGNSVLLPMLGKEFGFEIFGLDYSDSGCRQSRMILDRDNTPGQIILGDAFNPPADLLGKFDVVCSFGVVEHFEDTAGTMAAFAKFLKPGGLLITSIPNMKGATGLLHKWLNRPVYDIHVPLDKQDLEKAIAKAGLVQKVNEYFLALSFAITLEGHDGKPIPYYKLKKFFVKTIRYSSKVIWMLENAIHPLPAGKYLSGGVFTAAIKPQ